MVFLIRAKAQNAKNAVNESDRSGWIRLSTNDSRNVRLENEKRNKRTTKS